MQPLVYSQFLQKMRARCAQTMQQTKKVNTFDSVKRNKGVHLQRESWISMAFEIKSDAQRNHVRARNVLTNGQMPLALMMLNFDDLRKMQTVICFVFFFFAWNFLFVPSSNSSADSCIFRKCFEWNPVNWLSDQWQPHEENYNFRIFLRRSFNCSIWGISKTVFFVVVAFNKKRFTREYL